MKVFRSLIWYALIGGSAWFAFCVLATCLDYQFGFMLLLLNGLPAADMLVYLFDKLTEARLQAYLGADTEVVGLLLASWLGSVIWVSLGYSLGRWLVLPLMQKYLPKLRLSPWLFKKFIPGSR